MEAPPSLCGKINSAMRTDAGITKLANAKALFGEDPLALNAKPTIKVIIKGITAFISVPFNVKLTGQSEDLSKKLEARKH